MKDLNRVGVTATALFGLATSVAAQVPMYDIGGDGSNDRLGQCADSAGDVNNDGVDDFIIGAPENGDVFSNDGGYARVISGLDGSTLHTLTGVQVIAMFGESVAGIGDVNNDNFDDVAVGAPYAFGPGVARGSITVFSGQTGLVLFTFFGIADNDQLGFSVAGVGDLNNDGVPDIAGGALHSDVLVFEGGSVYLFSGADGSLLHLIEGQEVQGHLGVSMDGVGDFDGDGFGDMVAGGVRGPVSIFSGQTGQILMSYQSPFPESGWGTSVRSLGDITGDGVLDLIIGAPQPGIFSGVGPGLAHVINGATGALLAEMNGDVIGDNFGESVDSAGDFNGDGTVDYIVGAPVTSDTDRAGYARVFSGANGALLQSFPANANNSRNGAFVRLLGDLDGNGVSEVCVSQPEDSTVALRAGSVQVYSGIHDPCDPPVVYCLALANTTGNPAQIGWSGSNSFAANDLVLTASDCPPGQVGIFFYGMNQVFLPFGSGIRCVGGTLFRKPPVTMIDGSGNAMAPLNLNGLPNPDGQINEGDTWNFQLWFRDPGDGNAETNLTNALEVKFCP